MYLFVETAQLPENYQGHFAQNDVNVVLHEYYQFHVILKELIANTNGKIWTNPTSSYALSAVVPEKQLFQEVIYNLYSHLTKKLIANLQRVRACNKKTKKSTTMAKTITEIRICDYTKNI